MRVVAIAAVLALPLASFATAAGAAGAATDPVVVKRGGAELRMSEIDARLDEVPTAQRAGLMDSPERIETILSQMLLVEQLANEALQEGLDDDPRLARQLALVRNRLLAQFRLEQLRREAGSGVDLEALARERYAADQGKYRLPESRDLRHVLISTGGRADAEAKALAEAAQARLAAGESIESLARELSEDASTRGDGGLIRGVIAGQTDPAFDAALQALSRPGERVPGPVRSQYGYHLIELVAITPARQQTFDEVRAVLVGELENSIVEKKVRAHTDRLNGEALDADPELVASLRTRYVGPDPAPPQAGARTP